MKKVYVCLLALCMLALAFFTIYGEPLYEYGKPKVTTATASTGFEEEVLQIPAEALREDEAGKYVYVLMIEKGYSRTIHTVERRPVTVVERTREDGYVKLQPDSEIQRGDLVVTTSSGALEDGNRVLLSQTMP